jgi:hypothetical protein
MTYTERNCLNGITISISNTPTGAKSGSTLNLLNVKTTKNAYGYNTMATRVDGRYPVFVAKEQAPCGLAYDIAYVIEVPDLNQKVRLSASTLTKVLETLLALKEDDTIEKTLTPKAQGCIKIPIGYAKKTAF